MKTKYQSQISNDLMADIISTQKFVKKSLKDKTINIKMMIVLIRSWQGELGSLRRKKVADREIRRAELALAFLKHIHQDNLVKYESYYEER